MANATALLAVQAKLYTYLHADSTLMALAPIYDEVPDDTGFPYIEIGELQEEINNTFAKNGRTVRATLHIFSDRGGYQEVEQIVERLNILLDDTLLPNPSASWATVESVYELGTAQKDFDVVALRHFIAIYRFNVEQI